MIKIAKTTGELADSAVYLRINCNAKQYPTEFQTYAEGWTSLLQSIDHLRGKLGEVRHAQLTYMAVQAKAHYDLQESDEHQGRLGSWLMQDIEQVARGRLPFAYPEELRQRPGN